MNQNSSLTAAESLMLLFPNRSSASDLLKITFSELCLLNILSIKKEYAFTSSREDREALYTFVYFHHDEYNKQTLRPHQKFITSIFDNEPKLKITNLSLKFKKVVKTIEDYKRKYVFPELELQKLLIINKSILVTDLYKQTLAGLNVVSQLKNQILKAENKLPELINNCKNSEILEFLAEIKSNILLLHYCWLESEVDWQKILPKMTSLNLSETNINTGFNHNISMVSGFVWGGSFSSGYSINYTNFSFGGGDFGGAGSGDFY